MTYDVASLYENCRLWLHGRDPVWRPGEDPGLFRGGPAGAINNGVSRLVDADLDATIARARDYFAGVSWMWWAGADSRPGLAGELRERGATLIRDNPVMAVRLAEVTGPPPPPGLTVAEVTDAGLREWVAAYRLGMGSTEGTDDLAYEIERRRSDRPGTYRRFVARAAGKTVATAALLLTGDVAGLYVVATDPGHRRRGYAQALCAAALAEGRSAGATIGTLQATPQGRPVYERIGFTQVSNYELMTL